MTSEKILSAVLALLFAGIAIVAVKLTGENGYGLLFGFMSLLALIKTLDVDKWRSGSGYK